MKATMANTPGLHEDDTNSTYCADCGCRITGGMCKHGVTQPPNPSRQLTCCCCGELTQGRQWHNRDLGYGLCSKCAKWMTTTRGVTPEEMRDLYGAVGFNYNLG